MGVYFMGVSLYVLWMWFDPAVHAWRVDVSAESGKSGEALFFLLVVILKTIFRRARNENFINSNFV